MISFSGHEVLPRLLGNDQVHFVPAGIFKVAWVRLGLALAHCIPIRSIPAMFLARQGHAMGLQGVP